MYFEEIKQAELIQEKLLTCLSESRTGKELRNIILATQLDLAIEHHKSTLLLLDKKSIGTAFAIGRMIFELLYKALWVHKIADNRTVKKFSYHEDIFFKQKINMKRISKDLDKEFGGDTFLKVKDSNWKTLCDFTHSGMTQLARRINKKTIHPDYKEDEVSALVSLINGTLCMLAIYYFDIHKEYKKKKIFEDIIKLEQKK